MSTAAEDHTLGIHGKLQHVAADLNHEDVTFCVHHVLGADKKDTTTLSQEQVRKMMGISHINLANVSAMSIKTQNASAGLAAVTVKGGDDHPLPITHRQCAHVNGGVVAAHTVALPADTTTSGRMPFKKLTTDKHNYEAPSDQHDEDKQRNRLNAAFYPGLEDSPSEAKLFQDTITARHDGEERTAIPLVDRVTPATGGLAAVASRCILLQRKKPSDLCAGATLVEMPHKKTGEMCKHLVASASAVKTMAETVRANTAVRGTFMEGLTITTHGLGDHAMEGDHVISQITLHREPTGESNEVTYMKDLMPAEVQGGTITTEADMGEAHARQNEWHAAMFGKKAKAAAPQILHRNDGEQDGGTPPETVDNSGN